MLLPFLLVGNGYVEAILQFWLLFGVIFIKSTTSSMSKTDEEVLYLKLGLYPGGFYPPLRGARYLGQRPLFGPFESCMGKVCPQRSPCGHVRVLSCAAVPKPSTALRRAGSLIRARHCASARSSGTSALPFALLRWIPREGRFEADSFLGSGLRSTFRRNAQCGPIKAQLYTNVHSSHHANA